MNVAIGAGPVAGRPARTRRRTPSRRRLAGREWERACGAARCPLLEDDTGQRTNIQGIDLKQVTGAGNRVLLSLRTARHRGGSARRGASPPRACAGVRPAVPLAFHLGQDAGPPMEVEIWMCTGAAGRQACPCPSGDSGGAKPGRDWPGGETRWAGGGDEGGGERASRVVRL